MLAAFGLAGVASNAPPTPKVLASFGFPLVNLNSEIEQVVLVLLLVLVLENSRYLTVTLIERSSAGRFGPCFDAGSQQIETSELVRQGFGEILFTIFLRLFTALSEGPRL